MLPWALEYYDDARECLRDDFGLLRRGLLTSFFAPVVGLPRIFHLDEMEDLGFAWLTGGSRPPSRDRVGAWRRHLGWQEVERFCQRTSPWELIRKDCVITSYDEHTIPRWTQKFRIPKGYVTTRNKYMRCEKLFFTYDVGNRRYLSVRATRGNVNLDALAVDLLQETLTRGRPQYAHGIFDAGAGPSAARVRALWDLVEANRRHLDVTVRACRYPSRLRAWKQLPAEAFATVYEPGRYVGAVEKELRLAETRTVLRGESLEQGIRTIVCRELARGPKKDRWHPLFTTSDNTPEEVLGVFRCRQHHEQSYRVGVHDAGLDAVPCGYDKDSPNPDRPRWHRGVLQMMGWLVALVYNAVGDLALDLEGDFTDCHLQTVRRKFFCRPGTLYETPQALIVQLDWFRGQQALVKVIDDFNREDHRLPWCQNRRVVLSLTPNHKKQRDGP